MCQELPREHRGEQDPDNCLVIHRYALGGLVRLLTFLLLLWLFKEPLFVSSALSQPSQAVSSCHVAQHMHAIGAACKWDIISTHSHRDRIYVHIIVVNSFCWRLLVIVSPLWLGQQVPEWQSLKGPVVIDSGKTRGSSPMGKRTVG